MCVCFRVPSLNHAALRKLVKRMPQKFNKLDLGEKTMWQSQDSNCSLLVVVWCFFYHTSMGPKYLATGENSKLLLSGY